MQLSVAQRECERIARRLGVTDTVKVVWSRDCPSGQRRWGRTTYAHCHTHGSSRGTICLRERYFYGLKVRQAGGMLQHEVAHLVASSHNSIAFNEAAHGKRHHPRRRPFRSIPFIFPDGHREYVAGGPVPQLPRHIRQVRVFA